MSCVIDCCCVIVVCLSESLDYLLLRVARCVCFFFVCWLSFVCRCCGLNVLFVVRCALSVACCMFLVVFFVFRGGSLSSFYDCCLVWLFVVCWLFVVVCVVRLLCFVC